MIGTTRQEIIDNLVDAGFDQYEQGELSLEAILWEGFKGYENMTDEELESLNNSGLEEDEKMTIGSKAIYK